MDLEEVFVEFPERPLASGAIAQVYRARLREPHDGIVDVAVKIRHPNVRQHIARDLTLLQALISVVPLRPVQVYSKGGERDNFATNDVELKEGDGGG